MAPLVVSLYIIKRFRRRRRRRRVKNREGAPGAERGGVPPRPNYSKSPQGRIILSPPKAELF